MANNNKELLKAFNIKSHIDPFVKDYNAFKDKDLLDKFRSDILEDLSDKGFIDEVPYITDLQKTFYKTYITARFEQILKPAYDMVMSEKQELSDYNR